MSNYALYYPTIEFNDPEWLWNASLLYDRIYRIVPDSYKLLESRNIEEICSTGEIGIRLSPSKYAQSASQEFITKIEAGEWNAAGLTFSESDFDKGRIHLDKCDESLRQMIIAQNNDDAYDEFLPVSKYFAATYMSFLAQKIASDNSLQIVTDSIHAYTASNYFQFDGKVDIFTDEKFNHDLACLVISKFLPINILAIRPNEILKFRERFTDERRNFISAINNAAKEISKCSDEKIIRDMIFDYKKDIDNQIAAYRDAMRFMGVKEFAGWKTVTMPVLATLLQPFIDTSPAIQGSSTLVQSIGASFGMALGICTAVEKKRESAKKFEYNYLLNVTNSLPNRGISQLGYSFKEFIDD